MAPAPKRVVEGIQWPIVPDSSKPNDRSTTYANKAALAAATGALRPEEAAKITAERSWRKKYGKYLLKHVSVCLEMQDGASKAAAAGLNWLHQNFEFVRDGKTMPLAEAMTAFKSTFKTGTIKGEKPKSAAGASLKIPYKGKMLEGEALQRQVERWVAYGTIEPSAGEAILAVMRNSEWRDLSGKHFVLLGASSAMGPLKLLLELGASVVAIDIDRPRVWSGLLKLARASSGTLTFPLSADQSSLKTDADLAAAAGCNLLTQTPEILDWLKSVHPRELLVVGAYAYLDGELHVRVSLAMDAIIKGLVEDSTRPSVTPAYLCTPTDIHVITKEAHDAAVRNFSAFSGLFPALLKLTPLSWGGVLRKNFGKDLTVKGPSGSTVAGDTYYLVDGLVNRQGPNYALAKRIQHWRAVTSRVQHKCTVSSNIAPSTATASVTSNRLFAMAYGGMHWFKPIEVFQQETSNAVMGALLLRDCNDPKAKGASPSVPLSTPLEIFTYGSFHGGVWRMGYKVDSIGEASILMYAATQFVRFAALVTVLLMIAAGLGAASGHDFASIGSRFSKSEL